MTGELIKEFQRVTGQEGQSEIGFGITKLPGFDLLPRIKRINAAKLYRPAAGEPDLWPGLAPVLTRPIRWDRIEQQYDQMVKYATAIRIGTASTEAILRRFMKANAAHPTYQAMIEPGRAQKTIFLARYLRSRQLQREIHQGECPQGIGNRPRSSQSVALLFEVGLGEPDFLPTRGSGHRRTSVRTATALAE